MAKHPELTDEFLHVPGYIQPTDPGAVGGGMLWVDTAGGPGNYALKIRNDANTAWEAVSGGGGVNVFTALADTPGAYAGAANYKVVVNGTETALEFVPDAGGGVTVFTGLTDTPANYAGAALFGVRVNAGETGLEFVDFTGEFLPLAGGIMTGNIDFADLGEGIRFDDGAGAKFNGLKFEIVTDPEIVIGEEAPDAGGHPFVRANTGILRIGEGAGLGFGALEMWSEGAGSWVPIIQFLSDNPGDPIDISTSDNATNILGSETRPTYNGAELALLSDASGDSVWTIPHYSPGSGNPLEAVMFNALIALTDSGDAGVVADVAAWDCIRAFRGGAVSPTWSFSLSSALGATVTGNGNADSRNVYVRYTDVQAGQVDILTVTVSDGTTTKNYEVQVIVEDIGSGGGP